MDIGGIIDLGMSPFESRIIWFEQFCSEIEARRGKFFVYGASETTKSLLNAFFDRQLIPCCLCDSDENKWSFRISSVKTVSPEEAVSTFPDAVCVIAVRAAGAHFEAISQRLINAGCKEYYVLNWERCPRKLSTGQIEEVRQNKDALLKCRALLKDELSKTRFDSFVCAFLSSTIDEQNSPVIGEYKALDGHILNNELIKVCGDDVVISCRCGLDRRNDEFIKLIKNAKRVHLLEPCISSRALTAEEMGEDKNVFIYPYIAGDISGEYTEFSEKICVKGYIDFLEYSKNSAKQTAIDDLGIEGGTILHLDMGEFYAQALDGAARTVENGVRAIAVTGFQNTGDVVTVIEQNVGRELYFRHFGGQDMREGYAVIAIS